jgi:membrane associated rhomboid family serine protease
MPPITDIVKHLIIVNVIVFFAVYSPLGNYLPNFAVHWVKDPRFEPYQVITHMFMHASTTHLFFNMFALYVFGPMVERYAGARRFLILYFVAGMGSILAHMAIMVYQYSMHGVQVFPPAVGASGAIMGILVSFAVLYPNVRLMLLFPPIPIKAKYLAMAYVAIDLFSGISGANTGIANWAHLGGAITGFIVTSLWIKVRRR